MGAESFKELKRHVGHKIVCVSYSYGEKNDIENVSIECETCSEVLFDYDNDEESEDDG